MENTNALIGLAESFGVPLAILAVVLFIIYKTLPKYMEEQKSMNGNFAELVKTSTQAMTELLATFKSGNDANKDSFKRVNDRLDNLADKEDLKMLHERVERLADKDNLERLHVQADKIEAGVTQILVGAKSRKSTGEKTAGGGGDG